MIERTCVTISNLSAWNEVIILQYSIFVSVGDYVMIEPIAEGDKVKAEISHILYRPQVQFIQQQGLWLVRVLLLVTAFDVVNMFHCSHVC